ncbi:hypothetical protein [Vagococcus fluvialis]|uniref:Carrier domain-containing protein n=1 Tax=Vagococcus fluvialis bH819 TaxID=1255619 RepID=A0A1X6WRV1_9ENTE|nr:hypothetical protein [Vagococcus fluvialis]SLM86979.1 hypothetical protein FM121_12855 [Vagococcus fluvialis bH819]
MENNSCAILNKIKDKNYIYDEIKNLPLTGKILDLSAIDLTYLFLELEKSLSINFLEEDLINYKFNTLEGINFMINKKKGGK